MNDVSEFYFEKVKNKVFADRGFDLNQYSQAYVKRRLNARLMARSLAVNNYRSYLKVLETDPSEYSKLFSAFSINTTEFFRDSSVWEKLKKEYFPATILEKSKSPGRMIKVWSCGCSSGEEPYTIAILFKELRPFTPSLNILATDIDKDAIDQAEKGIYLEFSIKNVLPNYQKKYFSSSEAGPTKKSFTFALSEEIKQMVQFRIHNFIVDPPPLSLDFIFCRNVTIYLSARTKETLMEKFYQILSADGFLVIGKCELIFNCEKYHFYPVDLKEHIYRKR